MSRLLFDEGVDLETDGLCVRISDGRLRSSGLGWFYPWLAKGTTVLVVSEV